MEALTRILLLICSITIIHVRQVESSALEFEPKPASDDRILACYYRINTLNVTLIPPDVCTHILIAFVKISQDGIVLVHQRDIDAIRSVVKLKEKNPKLRVIISAAAGFPSVVSFGTETMLRCSLSTADFLEKYGLDGVDFDWETPHILEKNPLSEFLMILGIVLHRSNKTLSLAMPNNIHLFEQGFFADTINKYVDFITVMTYDFHFYTKQTNLTDYNSPLYSHKGDNPLASTAGALSFYQLLGVSASKMLIGFPTYARTWELANASVHGVHAPAVGLGAPGPVTNMTGIYLIQDICAAQKKGGKVVRDVQDGAEYMYYGHTWVAFNGMYSAEIKTDWLKKQNLAGVGVWTYEFDDPHNDCGDGPFPILRKIRSLL